MQRYVKTDYDGCSYITAGKVYEYNDKRWPYRIASDNEGDIFIGNDSDVTAYPCEHLDDVGYWQWCDKDGNIIND